MSLALQLSPEAENSGADTELINVSEGAEAGGPGVDNSSTLADLVSMFPSLDHDVAVVVLDVHNGGLEAAVEYLMNSSQDGATQPMASGYARLDPAQDMVGKFSADIGGLPEVLPRCLYEEITQEGEEDSDEEAELTGRPERSNPLPQQGAHSWLEQSDDPLPTYAEACRDRSTQVESPPESEGSIEDDHSTLSPVQGASEKQEAGASAGGSSKSKYAGCRFQNGKATPCCPEVPPLV